MPPLLQVQNLTTVFFTEDGVAPAVQDLGFSVDRGEVLGLVGESGCGKTVTSLSIMRLIRKPGKIIKGEILFEGENLLDYTDDAMRQIRGKKIAMVFQEPMTSLNPVFTIGSQMEEVLREHLAFNKKEARERITELLHLVGIPDPDRVRRCYPHELSGGMRQRALIAMGLACAPSLLIADEPTTALDVTIQTQILKLLKRLATELGMGIIFITHDLGVVAEICDRVAVMYASEIAEYANRDDIFSEPKHPYTLGLLQSLPYYHVPGETLRVLPGQVPKPTNYPQGCHFASRCNFATEKCVNHHPPFEEVADRHFTACWHWDELPVSPNMIDDVSS
ncbi:MAG: peptide ABC transporter ATP-binding protein [Ectothiorhodospiraceae bacterium]|nr:peptide ABC transporter ATP-binding protein [Ectothiorhodospiraceae bacterium]